MLQNLISYYERTGFKHAGESRVKYGGGGWHDMVSVTIPCDSVNHSIAANRPRYMTSRASRPNQAWLSRRERFRSTVLIHLRILRLRCLWIPQVSKLTALKLIKSN